MNLYLIERINPPDQQDKIKSAVVIASNELDAAYVHPWQGLAQVNYDWDDYEECWIIDSDLYEITYNWPNPEEVMTTYLGAAYGLLGQDSKSIIYSVY